MIRKILLISLAVALIAGSFFAGWSFKSKKSNDLLQASRQPIIGLVTKAPADPESYYSQTSETYQQAATKESFIATMSTLKDSEVINSTFFNNGSYSTIGIYELAKPNQSYEAVVSSINKDGKWIVDTIQLSEIKQEKQ